MLANTLNTNEVKNAAGTEIEFQRLKTEGRTTVFAQIAETMSKQHRLTISHLETGIGLKARRRSLIRIDKTSTSDVDLVTPITDSCYIVGDFAVGAHNATTEPANVVAELLSFCASLGASTTILYDCTGNGARELLQGGL